MKEINKTEIMKNYQQTVIDQVTYLSKNDPQNLFNDKVFKAVAKELSTTDILNQLAKIFGSEDIVNEVNEWLKVEAKYVADEADLCRMAVR